MSLSACNPTSCPLISHPHPPSPAAGQTYLLFRAQLAPPYTFASSTPETLEARLVAPDAIPWDEIAFSSVSIALRAYCDDLAAARSSYHHGTIMKQAGSAPNDPLSFELVDHFSYTLSGAAHAL